MSAEDLDKLFRDKLQNRPVAPSNDAWARLQARMQENGGQATPNPFMVPAAAEQKEERKPVMMWYYSAAAAVTMLLSVGLWVNRENIDPLQPSGTVATVQQTTPPATTAPAPAASNTVTLPAATKPADALPATASDVVPSQSQNMMASVEKQRPVSSEISPERAAKPAKTNRRSVPATTTLEAEPVMFASATPSKATEVAVNEADNAPLEIIVKLSNTQATSSAVLASNTVTETPDEVDQPSAGRVVKNIFKQVKNLRDGEKITREDLGIPKHTFALETRIGNRKLSKTIEL